MHADDDDARTMMHDDFEFSIMMYDDDDYDCCSFSYFFLFVRLLIITKLFSLQVQVL